MKFNLIIVESKFLVMRKLCWDSISDNIVDVAVQSASDEGLEELMGRKKLNEHSGNHTGVKSSAEQFHSMSGVYLSGVIVDDDELVYFWGPNIQ